MADSAGWLASFLGRQRSPKRYPVVYRSMVSWPQALTTDSSDELKMSVKTGASPWMFSFSRLVHTGSKAQDLTNDCRMISMTSAVVAGC